MRCSRGVARLLCTAAPAGPAGTGAEKRTGTSLPPLPPAPSGLLQVPSGPDLPARGLSAWPCLLPPVLQSGPDAGSAPRRADTTDPRAASARSYSLGPPRPSGSAQTRETERPSRRCSATLPPRRGSDRRCTCRTRLQKTG